MVDVVSQSFFFFFKYPQSWHLTRQGCQVFCCYHNKSPLAVIFLLFILILIILLKLHVQIKAAHALLLQYSLYAVICICVCARAPDLLTFLLIHFSLFDRVRSYFVHFYCCEVTLKLLDVIDCAQLLFQAIRYRTRQLKESESIRFDSIRFRFRYDSGQEHFFFFPPQENLCTLQCLCNMTT